jgi:hypothetical protein
MRRASASPSASSEISSRRRNSARSSWKSSPATYRCTMCRGQARPRGTTVADQVLPPPGNPGLTRPARRAVHVADLDGCPPREGVELLSSRFDRGGPYWDRLRRLIETAAQRPDPPATNPADYVHRHVELGWAVTGYGTQGDTVDVGIAVLEPGTTRAHAYVAMTRGRHLNAGMLIDATGRADPAETLSAYLAPRPRGEAALAVLHRPGLDRPPARGLDARPSSSRHALTVSD